MAKRFSIEAVFKAIDKMSAPVSRMQNRIGKFTRKMDRGLRKVNKSVGRFAQKMKKGALVVGVALGVMTAGLLNIINVGADFGRAIGSAAAKFPEDIRRGTQAFIELKDAARDVGRTTEFTATQAAKGLNFLAKAGFSASFSLKALKSFADFTTAAELEDFGRSVDIVTDVFGAFGFGLGDVNQDIKELNRTMDVLAATARKKNVDVEQFFDTVKMSGPQAAAAGFSLETFSAMVGVIAQAGIKASKGGTAIKNIANALKGTNAAGNRVIKALGIAIATKEGQLRDPIIILKELNKELNKLTQIKRNQLTNIIFGERAEAAAIVLMRQGAEGAKNLRTELLDVRGETKALADVIRDDVRGSLDSLKSAIESVKLSIFDMNEGPLKDTIDRITEWVRSNEELVGSQVGEFLTMLIDNFDKILNTIHNIGRAMLIFGIFAILIKTLTGAIALAKIAMIAFNFVAALNPIGLIVIAIAALIAIIVLLVTKWDVVKAFFVSLWDIIKSVIGGIGSVISLAGKFLGFGGDDEDEDNEDFIGPRQLPGEAQLALGGGGVISPQARTAALIEESRTTNTAEVTIKDETGKAELTAGTLGNGLNLVPSGGFD